MDSAGPKPADGPFFIHQTGLGLMAILNPNPPDFPSLWANSYGQDRFGLWQSLELKGVRQVMRWIPPGKFTMGSPGTEVDRRDNEKQHDVLISEGFWLADTACTQALWQAITGNNPSRFKQSLEHPLDNVSWDDCQLFIEQANSLLEGQLTLRLPSEAEWEYAARAGSQSAYWWGDEISDEQANYNAKHAYRDGEKGQYRKQTVEILQFEANDFGLFQVHGNVWEWCQDFRGDYPSSPTTDPIGPESGQSRVLRGGSWFNGPQSLRAALRFHHGPGSSFSNYGFRLAGG